LVNKIILKNKAVEYSKSAKSKNDEKKI